MSDSGSFSLEAIHFGEGVLRVVLTVLSSSATSTTYTGDWDRLVWSKAGLGRRGRRCCLGSREGERFLDCGAELCPYGPVFADGAGR